MTPRVRPAAATALPQRRAAVRRQERQPRRAARRPRSRCRPGSRCRPRRSTRSCTTPACTDRIAGALGGVSAGDVDAIGRPRTRSARRCGSRPVPDVGARGDRAALRRVSPTRRRGLAAGGGALERGRRGQPGRHVRRPAGDLPVGARGRARVRRGARLLGQPVQPAGDQLPPAPGRSARATPAMGVTVQLMVDAEVSGVMFTCNPVSGDPSMVAINASWGLGLAVVGGEVTPGRLPRQQGHARGGARARPRQAGRVRARRRRRAARSASRCPTIGATRAASISRQLERSSTWPAASSATSAPIRTSSGRSREA